MTWPTRLRRRPWPRKTGPEPEKVECPLYSPDGTCHDMDAICCENEGGEPKGPGTVCLGMQACCFPTGMCQDMDAICCENEGGEPQGPGSQCGGMEACCLPDGVTCIVIDKLCCVNEFDGRAQGPGSTCLDSDGDTVWDCNDCCPGVDDRVFNPGRVWPDCSLCEDAIPTVSEWGLVVLTLLLVTAGKIYFGRRRRTVAG